MRKTPTTFVTVAAILFLATSAFATTNNYSIGISFASDQFASNDGQATYTVPSTLAPTDLAGVPNPGTGLPTGVQANWNNALDANGTGWSGAYATPSIFAGLVADTNGVAAVTTATVEWQANGTWATSGFRGAGENNGTNLLAGTPDNLLMTGYIDVTGAGTPTLVTLRGLPAELTSGGYHVYVYSLGGARANRGGSIRILDTNGIPLKAYQLHTDIIGPTNYVKDPGASHTVPADAGNYHVFTNVAGSDIVIEATIAVNPNTGTPRASINAIQLIAANLSQPIVGGAFGDAAHFYVSILDLGGASVDTNTVTAVLNNQSTNVPVQITKQGGTTFVTYDLFADKGTFFASGSTTNQVRLVFSDTLARSYTNSQTFTVPAYTAIPGEFAVSAADTSKPGFRARTHQMPVPRGPGNRGLAANAERALAGGYIDPATSQPYLNSADLTAAVNGFFEIPGVINLHETAGGNTANFPADEQMPGIPGSSLTPGDYYVVDFQAYLQLNGGAYRFGVNSDDGFKLLAARGPGDVVGVILGQQDGTRGAADTIFDFAAPVTGFYPFRLVFNENTGGGSEVEFYMVDLVTGAKTLINGATSTVKAYRESAVGRPYVSKSLPARNYGFAFATDDLVVEITDGAVPVNAGSVSLTLNGAAVTDITKTGNVTTIRRTASLSNLLPSGANTITNIYSFTEGASTVLVTNTWTYTVVPYAVIPAANKVAPGTVTTTDPGFRAVVKQIDRTLDANQGNGDRLPTGDGNRMPRPEIHLIDGDINPITGLAYPNLAVAGGNPDGSYDITDVLNFNLAVAGTPPVAAPANSGIFTVDTAMPGLPGTGTSNAGVDNYTAEIVTYLDLKAGAYVFGGNSDDGFVVTSGLDARDTLGTRLGFFNGGRGNAGTLAVPSTTAANTVPTPGTTGGNSAFGFVVPEDGIYPFRILYWQGGGGVNLEFLSVDRTNGIEVLVNDLALTYPAVNVPVGSSAAAIPAYRTYTGPARPWVKFSVSPTPWDNRHQQTGPGPIVAYGRTPNNVESSDIYNDADNRRPWADVRIGGTVANGVGDATLRLLLDGAPVAATFTTNGTDVTLSYKPATPLASGSTHTASLVYGGTTNSWPFIVQTYVAVPASSALPLLQTDTNSVGFRVKMTQLATTPANQNTVGRAEAQLAGTLGADVSLPGPGANGTYLFPGIINWNNNRNPNRSGVEIGNFQDHSFPAGGWPFPDYPDEPLPGIPGTGVANNYTDNITAEVFGYLRFDTAGHYRFGVNSDDGFKLQVGTPGQTNGTVIFTIDVGKGASDIPFSFGVPQPGLYPMRLVYYNGGGGATLEYFSYDDIGNKIAINDTNNPAAIKAYYQVLAAPVIAITSPTNNTVFPDSPTNVTLTADATVQNSTISLVEYFYKSTIKIGESATFPYTVVWSNAAFGPYLITAKATAANGISGVSAPVKIIVGTPSISNVVETGGDNEATDTVTAKWTGVTFVGGIANEPIAGLAAGASYMVELFQEEAPCFVDRNHQWNGATAALLLPSYLVGNEYIMSGNDNRDNTNYNLAITLSAEADVYMLVDNRVGDAAAADPPNFTLDRTGDGQPDMAWLLQQGWTPVTNGLNRTGNPAWPDEVGVDEGGDGVGPGVAINNWSSVYVKRIPAGTFSIFQPDNNGQNMYGVVIARVSTVVQPPQITLIRLDPGNMVHIEWINGGTLEVADEVTGPWTDTTLTSPVNAPIDRVMRFGRIKR
jgi:hypothetical protein